MISACLITKNEEKFLAETFQSLKPLVSEIIVVDTGSTDNTVSIAKACGAIVYHFKWENNFAKARNFSLSKATQPWILIIDPDERLAQREFSQMQSMVQKIQVAAYSFKTRNYVHNSTVSGFKPCKGEYLALEKNFPGYFESKKIRLFRRSSSVQFVGSVHELVEPTIKGKVVDSEIPFHHYGSSEEVCADRGKNEFYQKQGEQKLSENPQDWKSYFELGTQFLTAGKYEAAVPNLEKANSLKKRDPLILSNLGFAYMETKCFQDGERVLNECLQIDSNYHDAYLNLGVIQMRQGRWKTAVQIFVELLKKHPQSFLAFRNLGLAFAHLGKFSEATHCFENTLKLYPHFTDARIDLAMTLHFDGRTDRAKSILQDVLTADGLNSRAKSALDEVSRPR